MNEREKRDKFLRLVEEKYTAIGKAVLLIDAKENPTEDEMLDAAINMGAGQAALSTAVSGNISSLTKAGLIPEDLGHQLLLASRQLAIDLQKAMRAQAILTNDENATVVPPVLH